MSECVAESIMIPLNEEQLHLKRIYKDTKGIPVFMLHGAIENGRIFYSNSGKGLAYFLADRGYDVYVADTRGRGKSEPRISAASTYGQTETITEEIPAFLKAIEEKRGEEKLHLIAHSWGGVLLSSYLARFAGQHAPVHSAIYFGTKRTVQVWNWQRVFFIDLMWNLVGRRITKRKGFLPAKLGSDNETEKSHRHSLAWVRKSAWIDPEDGFDYGHKIRGVSLPPTLYLTGVKDACLGHPEDVKRFIEESGDHRYEFKVAGKKFGNHHDYGHIDLLTHPDAAQDQFQTVLEWLKAHEPD